MKTRNFLLQSFFLHSMCRSIYKDFVCRLFRKQGSCVFLEEVEFCQNNFLVHLFDWHLGTHWFLVSYLPKLESPGYPHRRYYFSVNSFLNLFLVGSVPRVYRVFDFLSPLGTPQHRTCPQPLRRSDPSPVGLLEYFLGQETPKVLQCESTSVLHLVVYLWSSTRTFSVDTVGSCLYFPPPSRLNSSGDSSGESPTFSPRVWSLLDPLLASSSEVLTEPLSYSTTSIIASIFTGSNPRLLP